VVVRVGEESRDVRGRARQGDGYALLVDEGDRPLGWLHVHQLDGDGPIAADAATPGAPTVQPETTLRDALSVMLLSSVQLGVVVDDRDRVLGVISVDAISEALQPMGDAKVS
jgi:CBS domain containing-hemolysin-like protein